MTTHAHRTTLAHGLKHALGAAALLGVVSAFGDWLWATSLTDGALLPALVHGCLIFSIFALVLSWEADRGASLLRYLAALPALGFALALAFYPVAALTGYLPALLLSWAAMWLGLAHVQRWARRTTASPGGGGRASESSLSATLRGLAASVVSGLGFWAISGIWTEPGPSPADFGLLEHTVRAGTWAVAFLPGFLALMLGQTSPRPSAALGDPDP